MKKVCAAMIAVLVVISISITGAYAAARVGATLSSLNVEGGVLAPTFDPLRTEYTVSMPAGTLCVQITATAQKGWSISINGKTEKDGSATIPLKGTSTAASIQVSDGADAKVYKITITTQKESKYGRPVDVPRPADFTDTMSSLEKRFVETAFRLMPERDPFVLAYEEAHGVTIDSYTKTVSKKTVSGVPFNYGGNGNIMGYDAKWWTKTKDRKYPAYGMDCAEYVHWVYHNMGYEIPRDSAAVFFAGISGVQRYTPGINKTHWVIPSLSEARIGDIVYNSKTYTYTSGKGSHCGIFMGTARRLGIAETLVKYYPGFPVDAYLYIDTGWADQKAYYGMMRSIGIKGKGLAGVGMQYFPSVKGNDGKYIYESPFRKAKTRALYWKDGTSGITYEITASMEGAGRFFQHKPGKTSTVQYILNISRPIVRND